MKTLGTIALGFSVLAAFALGLRVFSIWVLGSPSATAASGVVFTGALLGLLLTLAPILIPVALVASVAGPVLDGWLKIPAALVYGTVLSTFLLTAVPEDPAVRPGILIGLILLSALSATLIFCIPVAKWFPVALLIPLVVWRFWFPGSVNQVVNPLPTQPSRAHVAHAQCDTTRWFETTPSGPRARFWFSRTGTGEIRLFQNPGWDPRTTSELLPITPQVVKQYCQQTELTELVAAREAEAARQAEEAERRRQLELQASERALEEERRRLAAQLAAEWTQFEEAEQERMKMQAAERSTSEPTKETTPGGWYPETPGYLPPQPTIPRDICGAFPSVGSDDDYPAPSPYYLTAPRYPVLDLNAASDRALRNALDIARTGPMVLDEMLGRRPILMPIPPSGGLIWHTTTPHRYRPARTRGPRSDAVPRPRR